MTPTEMVDHTLGLVKKTKLKSPDRDVCIDAFTRCINHRTNRIRKTKPKGKPTDPAVILWQLIRFHTGNGSLWGWPWFADSGVVDELDTFVHCLLNGQSSACAAWNKVLR